MSGAAPFRSAGAESARSRTVLIVHDEHQARERMTGWLESGGYTVATAASAEEALAQVDSLPPAVAVCDIRVPGHGRWLAERIRSRRPETAVVLATGHHDAPAAVENGKHGAIDYVIRPFERGRLQQAVVRGLEWHRAACDRRRWRESLEQDMMLRRARLADAIDACIIDTDERVDAVLSALTLDDRDAYAHAYRVAALSVSVGRMLGLQDVEIAALERAALLHDLGKLAIPDAILRKPAPLTAEEQAIVRLHPTLASDLISGVPYLSRSAAIVRDAHERMDGRGYPRGIRASEVSLSSRIIAVADAFDSMIRPRVFRDALNGAEALLELERCSGSQFDEAVVAAFRRVIAAQ